jgi:alpha-D-ribose 1-methylphosphonate 5-triphosphate synthase subunit PhnG
MPAIELVENEAVVKTANGSQGNAERRRWMGILARTPGAELEKAWRDLGLQLDYDWLRQPEVGLVMVPARAGGTGDVFNLTEMSLTRCALRLADGTTGYAYVQGRDTRQAELAAVFDALMQQPERRSTAAEIIDRLEALQAERQRQKSLKAASTKVEFFTMVRERGRK